MPKNGDRRRRHLRTQRERLARKRTAAQAGRIDAGEGAFHCESCRDGFTANVYLTTDQVVSHERATAMCPRCGEIATAENQFHQTFGGVTMVSFPLTPRDVAWVALAARVVIDQLSQLDQNATVTEILEVLDAGPAAVQPVAEYVRKHHVELAGLGLSLLSVVIALLTWLAPLPGGDHRQPEPPDGITPDQMERLIREVRQEARHAHQDEPGRRDRNRRDRERQAPAATDEHGDE